MGWCKGEGWLKEDDGIDLFDLLSAFEGPHSILAHVHAPGQVIVLPHELFIAGIAHESCF